jgi:hypothetical protein
VGSQNSTDGASARGEARRASRSSLGASASKAGCRFGVDTITGATTRSTSRRIAGTERWFTHSVPTLPPALRTRASIRSYASRSALRQP